MNVSGTPTGRATPSASRTRPASSIAIQRCSPAIRTRIARRVASSSSSHSGAHPARGGLLGGQVAEEAQQVGGLLDVAGVPVRRQPLQTGLQLVEHLDVEQLTDRLGPSSSASSVESNESAAARRSASGASSS